MTIKNSLNKPIFGLIGAGGFGRETISFINNLKKKYEIYFVDNMIKSEKINDVKIISDDEFLNIKSNKKYFNISISNGKKREELSNHFKKNGAKPLTIFSKNSAIHEYNIIGDGCILCDYTVISPNAKIGNFVHVNRGAQIAHDTTIGNYVTFAPFASCNGNTIIEDYVYLGTGVIMRHGTPEKPLKIGKGSVIGMGAVVTKDVPPNVTVVGNPAKQLIK